MTLNNEVHVQRKTLKRTRLFFILNRIRKNVKSHYEKRNKKENTTIYRDKTDNKRRHIKKSYIRILRRIINIFER